MARDRSAPGPLLALALLVAGCAAGSEAAGSDRAQVTQVTVAAASSLTAAFTDLADAFGDAHPDVEVSLTFGASSTLAVQLVEGAPADVFAAADDLSVEDVAEAGLLDADPLPFATNRLVIVTRPGNPEGIGSLGDLAGTGIVSLCAEAAPCGRYAARALAAAEVPLDETRVSRGPNAQATLTAVTEGDAVAGVVYLTDARAAGAAAEVVPLPEAHSPVATYLIGILADGTDRAAAAAFVAFVLGPEGQAVLAAHGFGRAP